MNYFTYMHRGVKRHGTAQKNPARARFWHGISWTPHGLSGHGHGHGHENGEARHRHGTIVGLIEHDMARHDMNLVRHDTIVGLVGHGMVQHDTNLVRHSTARHRTVKGTAR